MIDFDWVEQTEDIIWISSLFLFLKTLILSLSLYVFLTLWDALFSLSVDIIHSFLIFFSLFSLLYALSSLFHSILSIYSFCARWR